MIKKHIIENKFNYFLGIIIGMMLISPLFSPIGTKGAFPFILLFYTFTTILILKTLISGLKTFILVAAVYVALFIIDAACSLMMSEWTITVEHISIAAHAVVLGLFIHRLFEALFTTSKVTADSIKGGICIYFLFGLFWGILYHLISFYDPHAFVYNVPGNSNLFYFSYVTLTTMGYGDIIPGTRFTQALAILEAMTGQLFVAVYIARLLGLHLVSEMKTN